MDTYIAVVSTMYLARPHIVYIVYCIVYSLHFRLHKLNCGSTLKILEKDRERLILSVNYNAVLRRARLLSET